MTPIAGTTRDSIDTAFKWYGKTVTLVDTAGLRKKAKVSDNIEFYSNLRTHSAIEQADVSLVLIDAEKGFSKQDKELQILKTCPELIDHMMHIITTWSNNMTPEEYGKVEEFMEGYMLDLTYDIVTKKVALSELVNT